MATTKPGNVDEYIAGFSTDVQKRLKLIRAAILKAAPDAEEYIGYNIPSYKLNGMLVSFAAWKTHIGLYPSPSVSGEFKKRLAPYEGAKSTLRFPFDKSLPQQLITKIVKLRMKENLARTSTPLKKKK